MAETLGKLVTCDRCAANVFLKRTGEKETDGGYTRWNIFEPSPEGWEYHTGIGLLCPVCNGKYKALVNSFMTTEGRDDGRSRTAGK